MSVVSSSLTHDQEKKLFTLLGQVKLSLLYKASVHGYASNFFHAKCDLQGPTVSVAFNQVGFLYGAYISKNYGQTGAHVQDEKAFLFSLGPALDTKPYLVTSANGLRFTDGNTGPNFGSLRFLEQNGAATFSNPTAEPHFDPQQMHGNDQALKEFEVYRVEECHAILEKPWRNIMWNQKKRENLMDTIKNWHPNADSIDQARVLLVGQVGAGKSSFFNSLSSVFRGHVTSQANTGTSGTSLTTQFRTYSIRGGPGGKALPLVLCDTMGLEEGPTAGLSIEDFTNILKGNVLDRYKFNPLMPLEEDAPGFHRSNAIKDKIHCVVFVVDAAKFKLLPTKMIEKFAALRRKASQLAIPQLVLMTKVDEACPAVAEDLTLVYQSRYIKEIMQEVSGQLGVPVSAVIPVKNYSEELELYLQGDILLLSAALQILRVAEGYFDDLYQEKSE